MLVIPALRKLRQEDLKFKASLSYINPVSKPNQTTIPSNNNNNNNNQPPPHP
jgi:hypothetical protein